MLLSDLTPTPNGIRFLSPTQSLDYRTVNLHQIYGFLIQLSGNNKGSGRDLRAGPLVAGASPASQRFEHSKPCLNSSVCQFDVHGTLPRIRACVIPRRDRCLCSQKSATDYLPVTITCPADYVRELRRSQGTIYMVYILLSGFLVGMGAD